MKTIQGMTARILSMAFLLSLLSMKTAAQSVRPKCPLKDCLSRCSDKSKKFPNPSKAYARCSARCDRECKTPSPSNEPTVSMAPSECPPNHKKKVSIVEFGIQGDLDIGDDVEISLKINGKRLWKGFKNFDDSDTNAVSHTPISMRKGRPLSVSLEDYDFSSFNEKVSTRVSDWYQDTCEVYFLTINKEYKSGNAGVSQKCIELSSGKKLPFKIGISYCSISTWKTLPESVTWIVKVEPDLDSDD